MIRWITPSLGTGPAYSADITTDMVVVDVRDFVDKGGNPVTAVRARIEEGLAALRQGRRVVVTCDYGISRSNALASGMLALKEGMPLDQAVARTMAATGEKDIKIEPLAVVRAALGERGPEKADGGVRLLVTGATGFIGRALVAGLPLRHAVFTPTREEIDLQSGTVQLDALARGQGITHLVHLANPKVSTSNKALGDSLTMLANVLDTCKQNAIKLVYLSGWDVFSGYATTELLADESCPLKAKGPAGTTKVLCEQIIGMYQERFALSCAILRPTPTYGPGVSRPKFLHNFIHEIHERQSVTTHRYRNGDPRIDLLYIDDLVNAIVKTLERDFSGTLNLGSGTSHSTIEIASLIARLSGREATISHRNIEDSVANIVHDIGLAERVLDWRPQSTLSSGLTKILEGYSYAGT
ncbi:NAD-dependent epimerase/dehydratase family protein [Solidesulfovibrio sp.]|uniref:NAD-dependent epimerase/dehydratase family protein n=1 Tax=Solidesulfovibrio sp. TaxID=2910990 RepID=UPI00263A1B85|nr:NAD-dependent epimerase/dehydratase family protein [Solidesulfovibrio sp.]